MDTQVKHRSLLNLSGRPDLIFGLLSSSTAFFNPLAAVLLKPQKRAFSPISRAKMRFLIEITISYVARSIFVENDCNKIISHQLGLYNRFQ